MIGKVDEKRGPERPTLIERFVDLIHLPYAWGCLIWAVFFAVVGPLIGGYLDTFDLSVALAVLLNPGLSLLQGIASLVLNIIAFGFLPIFLVRFMRSKVVLSEPELIAISPHGEETLHKVFGGVSRSSPPILLGVALVGVSSIPGVATPIPTTGLFGSLFLLVDYLFSTIGFGSFVWMYLTSLRGLDKLGGEALRLRPPSEDPMLGLRPLGAISLSFGFAYFALLGLLFSNYFFLPFDFVGSIILPIFIIIGLVMFFLPLKSFHRQMKDVKRLEQMSIRKQLALITVELDGPGPGDSQTSLQEIKKLMAIQILDHKASAIPTWPFDTGMLGRFTAIILSVVTILIARLVIIALHL